MLDLNNLEAGYIFLAIKDYTPFFKRGDILTLSHQDSFGLWHFKETTGGWKTTLQTHCILLSSGKLISDVTIAIIEQQYLNLLMENTKLRQKYANLKRIFLDLTEKIKNEIDTCLTKTVEETVYKSYRN